MQEPLGSSPCSIMSSNGIPPEECVYKKGQCDEIRLSCENGKWNATGTDRCVGTPCPRGLPDVNSVCSESNNEDCPYNQGVTDQGNILSLNYCKFRISTELVPRPIQSSISNLNLP